MGEGRRPLSGRTVLLTRPGPRSAALVERLEGLGATVEARPTIALEPPSDPAPARRAVRRLGTFDWILFTSVNGVRFFLESLSEAGAAPADVTSRVAAIGPATALALAGAGIAVEIVAQDSRSEGLAGALHGCVRRAQRVLIVGAETSRTVLADELSQAGAEAERVAFYRNVAAPGVAEVARRVGRGCYDVVVFSSPSTLERLLVAGSCPRAELLQALGRAALVAIGRVTARALEEAGLRASAVAATPTDDGIADAVAGVFHGPG